MTTKKGSVLTCDLYRLFQDYIHGGCVSVPDSRLLENMVSEPVNNAAKRKRLRKKFKSWAARLAVRPGDNQLVYKSTGKVIVPEEYFVQTIERKHCSVGGKHLTLSQTIDAVMAEYSVGKREFGIDRDLIVAVVNHCLHPDCQRACLQRQHHRISNAALDCSKHGNYRAQSNEEAEKEIKSEETTSNGWSPYDAWNRRREGFYEAAVDEEYQESQCRFKISKSSSKSHRFAPIQPKPGDIKKTDNSKNEILVNKSCSHIPVQLVPVSRGMMSTAVARPRKPEVSKSEEAESCDKPPVKMDELYSLLLKRIQLIRRVLRPSLATNSPRLQDALKTYINDGITIINSIRRNVATPTSSFGLDDTQVATR